MHISKLQIENLRSFEKATLEFNLPGTKDLQYPNVNVLLGDNGLGKTSILKAVALAVLGPLLSGNSGFVPEGLIRRAPAKIAGKVNLKKNTAILTADIISTVEERPLKAATDLMPETFSVSTEVRTVSSVERMSWHMSPRARMKRSRRCSSMKKARPFSLSDMELPAVWKHPHGWMKVPEPDPVYVVTNALQAFSKTT